MEKLYYDVYDIMELLGCSKDTAYRKIRKANDEMKGKGYITYNGRVLKEYFNKRIGRKEKKT